MQPFSVQVNLSPSPPTPTTFIFSDTCCIGCFAFGYLLWQLDFIFCPQLTALKRKEGIPWGFLLELHGWWHVLTAIGAHTFMVMVDGLTSDKVEFLHDAFGWFKRSGGARAGKKD